MPAWLRVTAKELSKFDYWKKEAKRLRWQIRKIENPDRVQRGVTDEMVGQAKQVPLEKFIDIKKEGSPKMAICPFHDDTDPSLAVYDNNTYYCFGCGTSGDVIKYIQKTRDLDFINAVKFLL
jgi:DNA primase